MSPATEANEQRHPSLKADADAWVVSRIVHGDELVAKSGDPCRFVRFSEAGLAVIRLENGVTCAVPAKQICTPDSLSELLEASHAPANREIQIGARVEALVVVEDDDRLVACIGDMGEIVDVPEDGDPVVRFDSTGLISSVVVGAKGEVRLVESRRVAA